jgi:hypothetical protein
MTELSDFATALGERLSGRVRYGAAMALFSQGELSAEQLECYRVASADDRLDPKQLLLERGLPLPAMTAPGDEALLRTLVDEIDCYLGRLKGPGIAEVRHGIQLHRKGLFAKPSTRPNPVVEKHLATALAAASEDEPALGSLIAAAAPKLNWITYDLYDRALIGEAFATSHAYCTIIGTEGAIRSRDFDLGLFLIAPHILYRDHRHPAPELYAPLTGPHGWRFKPGASLVVKPAHEPVWNEANRPHLTKVGPTPFLCFYCWTRDNDKSAEVLPAADWLQLEETPI